MKKFIFLLHFVFCILHLSAQNIGIGTTAPATSAKLDIASTTSGLLVPRMSSIQRTSIATPAQGLLVYDTDTNTFWFYNASVWTNLSVSASGGAWSLTGNSVTNPSTHFMGTTDNQPLRWRVNNTRAGEIHPTNGNVFFGLSSGQANTIGYQNTANGANALKLNTSGHVNTALGNLALASNTTGHFNTAIGGGALSSNTVVSYNTATGYAALSSNTVGFENTANGAFALSSNTTANENTAIGYSALSTQSYNPGDTWPAGNVAIGHSALFSNQPTSIGNGIHNTAVGTSALRDNTTGYSNTATGYATLYSNSMGTTILLMGIMRFSLT